MAAPIGAKIAIQGEREFRKAVSEINSGLKVTSSELKLVTAQYANNSTSVAALTAKNAVLNKQITEQTEKIERLKGGLEKATAAYGATDTKTLEWQRKLNSANTELLGMQDKLNQNSNALDKARDDMEKYGLKEDEVAEQTHSVGDTIADLAGKLGIQLPAGADKAIRSLDKAQISAAALVGVTATLVKKFGETTIETAKTAHEITNLSQTMGMSTDAYQEWDYVLKQNGYSMEQAQGDLSQLAEKAADAANGVGEGAEMFTKLRIRVQDTNGHLKSQEQLFGEVVTKLQGMTDETERNAIASALLNTTGEKLVPTLNMTAKELEAMKKHAHEMGYVIEEDALGKFDGLNKSMTEFDSQTTAFKNSIAMVMLPVLAALFETLNKIDPKIVATVAIIGSIAVVAVTVVKGISSVTGIFKGLDTQALKTTAIVIGVVAALIALAAIIAVLVGKGGEVEKTMSSIGNSVGQVKGTVNNARSQTRYTYSGYNGSHAGGLDYVPFDGYIAQLHRGERVQTAAENPYNGGSGGGDTIILNVKMSEVDEVYKLMQVVKQAKQTNRAGKVALA